MCLPQRDDSDNERGAGLIPVALRKGGITCLNLFIGIHVQKLAGFFTVAVTPFMNNLRRED
jgi:hypothetical protein